MKNNKDIEHKINRTLQSLDGWERKEVDAFFYTRLSAKMENFNEPFYIKWFFDTPLLKPALLVLFITINLATLFSWIQSQKKASNSIGSVTESFIDEYELNQNTDTFLVLNEE